MIQLNFPAFRFAIRTVGEKQEIFDPFRKKYVSLTPEEWVRQHTIQFLVNSLNVPASLMVVEKSLVLNKMKKRADVLVYGNSGMPVMLVECKSPGVKISQKTFDQVARYNMVFKVQYLFITNGLEHFCCIINFDNDTYFFLENIPDYKQMCGKIV
jgi:hypothetical protein